VSARQFREAGFVERVQGLLDGAGLPESSLMLELTESVLLPHDDRINDDLKALKAAGVKLAIDDFGTGYSSLSYLRGLPIDVVKIDKSFVDGIDASEQQQALVDGIIRLARTLGLEVIAEGIENEAQRDRLKAMGCRYGQGYLLAMPMPPEEAESLAVIGRPVITGLPGISRLAEGPRSRVSGRHVRLRLVRRSARNSPPRGSRPVSVPSRR
jgi:EAL domain-containing protein (putative c-di-GMP-specific phosphodiesterase class I)